MFIGPIKWSYLISATRSSLTHRRLSFLKHPAQYWVSGPVNSLTLSLRGKPAILHSIKLPYPLLTYSSSICPSYSSSFQITRLSHTIFAFKPFKTDGPMLYHLSEWLSRASFEYLTFVTAWLAIRVVRYEKRMTRLFQSNHIKEVVVPWRHTKHTIGFQKSSSEACFTPKVGLFKFVPFNP